MLNKRTLSHARLNPPVLVMVAATAIIMTRGLDLFMVFDMMGVHGLRELIQRSAQTWPLTLVFLGSLLVLCIELRCAFVVMKGRNWGRWLFLITQILSSVYLMSASLGWGYPELFSLPGETPGDIFRALVTKKLPDVLVLFLLFIPPRSRLFFRVR
ncbi:YbjO family protein [Enterobacteriaceae bacterium YMB-R22]|uniref:YbjO family protein n=1 Tax=Tenebrionicola larvae TaxID=2815733 RepID=UPI00201150DB|nr:YbjO family protein [Tenebrionicola larvae]MBV4412249.1 YbjO family protein [Tenebrionicola larvae]